MSADTTPGLEAERAAFEAWARTRDPAIRLEWRGETYRHFIAREWWEAWQAARRAPAPAPQGPPAAWLVDWPEEPDLGHYFAEDRSPSGRSRPLYLGPSPQGPTDPDIDALWDGEKLSQPQVINRRALVRKALACLGAHARQEPSDAEIAETSLEFVGMEPLSDFDYVAFARAVLARWGAPAASGEPVARKPLSADAVRQALADAGYDRGVSHAQRADFINGLRHGEVAHGIKP
ncbi:hypothetical protein [Acidovorax sp. NCPPB 4044]|uniref:hypothetical protein n=1 Tax=Acidovorax sp. NCPPB 4044 TaxID=2940490 RepID=UPI002303E4DF|nr:hypothetical protein [Acidovorax sp. NCPPB 4044]MDA8522024.1 hypothetical protein [Acidovorax sp. NCPPB 4044]